MKAKALLIGHGHLSFRQAEPHCFGSAAKHSSLKGKQLHEKEIRSVFNPELVSYLEHFYYEEGNICVQYKLSPQYIKSFTWHKYKVLPKKGKKWPGGRTG